MSVRLAACDPCRHSKLACGHERPICTRCSDRGRDDVCVYRSRPFRRKAPRNSSKEPEEHEAMETDGAPAPQTSCSPADTTPSAGAASIPSTQPYRYPNPGYLGISSHSTLFNQVFSRDESDTVSHHDVAQRPTSTSATDLLGNQVVMDRAMHALSRLDGMNISNITPLVRSWLEKGVNLPLAGPLVSRCLWSVEQWRQLLTPDHSTDLLNTSGAQDRSASYVRALLVNTLKAIVMRRDMSMSEYLAQMLGKNLRWETLGIFFAAAARAAYDTPYFTPLYANNEQRRRLIQALTYIGDCCLETCLSLDCLNDFQLILQYENFIVHSQIDGDQSYHSWRRIGDVASSLFAMGYHEKIDGHNAEIPHFINELRKACFARIYAADKSLAVFLGRPPRIVKEYCHFKIPNNVSDGWVDGQGGLVGESTSLPVREVNDQMQNLEPINYTADTRCSALFALLKEEVLQILRRKHTMDITADTIELHGRVEKQWQDLPAHFKLTTSLRDCQSAPFERDFLAGTRLDYLHILFLLGLASQPKVSEPNDALLMVATEMLSITVEVIILRDQLVNSGSCLIWKVAQYGLPAAGVVSLALLKATTTNVLSHSRSKMIQDLSVLVAEIVTGAWIQAGEPNFALFTRATRTIQTLLDSLLAIKPRTSDVPQASTQDPVEAWEPYGNHQLWDFEMDFWANLAEHPTLLS